MEQQRVEPTLRIFSVTISGPSLHFEKVPNHMKGVHGSMPKAHTCALEKACLGVIKAFIEAPPQGRHANKCAKRESPQIYLPPHMGHMISGLSIPIAMQIQALFT